MSATTNVALLNTNLYALPLEQTTTPASGIPVTIPMPMSETVSVVVSSASLGARVGPDPTNTTQWLFLTPEVALSDSTNGGGSITVTVTDSTGDLPDLINTPFDIVGVASKVSIANLPIQVVGTQAVPTNAGP